MREDNRTCADCRAPAPEWASTNLGIFICIDCSGIHRSFGTHISKVRSVKLDKWDKESTLLIDSIGNRKANQYWEHYIPPSFSPISPTSKLFVSSLFPLFSSFLLFFLPRFLSALPLNARMGTYQANSTSLRSLPLGRANPTQFFYCGELLKFGFYI